MEESLGKILRKARESTGKTVDDAVYLAKIPRSVVEALEAEDFGFFTSPLYARSFLKQYGDYIGADVETWLDDLEPTTMIDGEAVESFIDISEPIAAAVTQEKSSGKNKAGGGAWAALWMLLITCGLVWGGIKVYQNFETKLSEADPDTNTQAQADESQGSESVSAGETESGQADEAEPLPTEEKSVAEAVPEPPRRAIIVHEEP